MRSIAIIHSGGLGDLVQTLPVVDALRAKWPRARLTLVGHGDRCRLLEACGAVEAVVELETCGLHRLLAAGAARSDVPAALQDADLVVNFLADACLEDNLRRLTRAAVVGGRSFPPPGTCNRPACEFVYEQVAPLLDLPRLEACEPRLRLPAGGAEAAAIERRFPEASRSVAVHPGSGSPKKNWPRERFAELSALLESDGLRTIWILGPAELERPGFAELVRPDSWDLEPPDSATPGRTGSTAACRPADCLAGASLVEVAALLSRARVYVGNDSGVTHLAAALGARTVALFGPSEPAVWAPRGAKVEVVAAPRGDLSALEVEQVLGAVRRALGRRGAAAGAARPSP